MGWGAYAILILFGAFVVLLIINPNISCFGKRVRSPFYPLRRKRDLKRQTTDYKFDLGGGAPKKPDPSGKATPEKKTEDYGFRLR